MDLNGGTTKDRYLLFVLKTKTVWRVITGTKVNASYVKKSPAPSNNKIYSQPLWTKKRIKQNEPILCSYRP